MLNTKSRLLPGATGRAGAAVVECDVLRGVFEDQNGRLRQATVVLSAGSPGAPVLLAADNGTVIDVLGRFPGLAILPVTIPARHPVAAGPLPLPRYDGAEIETFHLLRCLLRRAIRDADSWLLGQVATSSARIHQRRQPKPGFDALLNVAASFDAIGVAVAAGNRAALLFDPGKQDLEWSMHAAARALRELGMGCVVDAPSRSIRPGL